MENKDFENSLNELIRTSMELEDKPSSELNLRLKAELYQKEAAISRKQTHSVSLWYVPMILNFISFSLFAVFALLHYFKSIYIKTGCRYLFVYGDSRYLDNDIGSKES